MVGVDLDLAPGCELPEGAAPLVGVGDRRDHGARHLAQVAEVLAAIMPVPITP